MKKLLLILGATLCFAFLVNAQAPEKLNFQAVLYDPGNNLLTNQPVSLQFSLLKDSPSGTLVYQETQTLSSNDYGLVNLKIGTGNVVFGNFSTIDWSTGIYFLETAMDLSGGTDYKFMGTSQLLNVPYSLRTPKTGFAENADYNSLANIPLNITSEQAEKLGFISITEAVNLDTMRMEVDNNLDKTSFPGFGTTAGTAYEILWTEIADSAYYLAGNIGMGVDSSSSFAGSALHVGGGILQRGIPSDSTAGLLHYDSIPIVNLGPGAYYFYDDELTKQTFNVENSLLYQMYFIDSTMVIKDHVFWSDMNILANLGIGSQSKPGYSFDENNMAVIDSIIRFYFWDTSNSSAFPTADWKIELNDATSGGQNYFAFVDTATGLETIPFKIMAGAPTYSTYVKENGFVGIGTNSPAAALDINGTLAANTFVGEATNLANIPAGTSSILNIGSTTIGADNDNDTNGELIFETQNTNKLVIANNGNVGIGNPTPTNKLDVNGTATMQSMQIENNLLSSGSLSNTIFNDLTNSTVNINLDVSDKSIIMFNSTGGNITISSFLNGVVGQKVTLINLSNSNNIDFSFGYFRWPNTVYFPPGNLNQYATATFVYNGTYWLCTDIII